MRSKAIKAEPVSRRLKIGLTAGLDRRLQTEAHASGLTESGLVVRMLEEKWRSAAPAAMPVYDPHLPIVHAYADNRIRVAFSDLEHAHLNRLAELSGIPVQRYIHDVVIAAWGVGQMPRPPRNRSNGELAVAMNLLAWQVSKLGTNLNQLAKQANAGMVQVSRNEIQYLLNQHQVLLSQATAAMERVLR